MRSVNRIGFAVPQHLAVAQLIAARDPAVLPDFVGILARKVQFDAMCGVVEPEAVRPATPFTLLFPPTAPLTRDGRSLEDLALDRDAGTRVDLARDVLLPWPWSAERLADALSNIGAGRRWGAWREHPLDHRVEVWLPFRIGWVIGGNHSIASLRRWRPALCAGMTNVHDGTAAGCHAGGDPRRHWDRATHKEATMRMAASRVTRVLVVEDDATIAGLVKDILEDDGLAVTVLAPASPAALHEAVRRWEPACILLDGAGRGDYGYSWVDAARLHRLARSIPVIMFSVDGAATTEARTGTSARNRAASFAAVLDKPFDLDHLVAAVRDALRRNAPAAPGDHNWATPTMAA